MKNQITVFVFLLILSVSSAQITINGKVTESSNKPISGANIYLESTSFSPLMEKISKSSIEVHYALATVMCLVKDIEKTLCRKDVESSLQLFANFKPESEFHPNWGENRAREVAGQCKV